MLWKFPIKHNCIEILHLHFGGVPPPLLFSLPEVYFEEISKFSLGRKPQQFKKETYEEIMHSKAVLLLFFIHGRLQIFDLRTYFPQENCLSSNTFSP